MRRVYVKRGVVILVVELTATVMLPHNRREGNGILHQGNTNLNKISFRACDKI